MEFPYILDYMHTSEVLDKLGCEQPRQTPNTQYIWTLADGSSQTVSISSSLNIYKQFDIGFFFLTAFVCAYTSIGTTVWIYQQLCL